MKKIIFTLTVLGSLLTSCNKDYGKQTKEDNPNEHLVMATLWFQRSSECRALYYQAYNMAKLSLDKQLTNNTSSKPKAVVVDIDETVLDNSPFETNSIRTKQTFTPKAWDEWVNKASAKATPGALEFLKYAQSKGVETFYISNRSTTTTKKTLENLKKLGFPYADEKHLLLKTTTSVKTKRRHMVGKTHDILIYAGDNIGDFDEFYEDRSLNYGFDKVDSHKEMFGNRYIVLPNPMYGGWEKEALKSNRKLSSKEKTELRKEKLIGYDN